jgi:outer membrane receptor protein involved in Fe transport
MKKVCLFALFFYAIAQYCFSQSLGNAGTIYVTVTDPSQARIPSAAVSLFNEFTKYSQHIGTDGNGEARFTNVPFNEYHLEIKSSGFEISHRHISVRSAVPIHLAAALKIMSPAESITVSPETPLIEETPIAHTDLSRDFFDKIPQGSIASGMSDMITLGTPGVVADSNGFFHSLGDHAQAQFVIDGQPITDQQGNIFSNQLPTSAIQSMEAIYGAIPAEYGDKTSLVVTAVTRSGLGLDKAHGNISSEYGSFGTVEQTATLGVGKQRWGNFAGVTFSRSGRFLDTPEFNPLHAIGNNESIFDRFDFQPSQKDAVHLNIFAVRSWFQIPNDYDQQAAGQDQRQLVKSINIAPGWVHVFGNTTLTINPFFRQERISYYPSPDPFSDQPATMSQTRRLTNYGVRSYLEYFHGRHNAKIGLQITSTPLTENFRLAITDSSFNPVCLTSAGDPVLDPAITQAANCAEAGYQPNPDLAPGLVPYDLTRGGSYFSFHGRTSINQQSAYLQDSVTLGKFRINGGFRFDRYDGLSQGTSWQPRLGFSYSLSTSTLLRISYSRTYETPQNENLILSSATGAGGLANTVFNAYESVPLRPGKRNQFNAGFQQSVGHYIVVDGDYFWKYTHNAYDLDTLLNTAIVFPIVWAKSKMDGFSARVSLKPIGGLSAYALFGHTRARIFGPEVGGLIFSAPLPDTVGRIDHDQEFQSTTHVQYQPNNKWPWIAFTWRYDSGIVSGGVPDLDTALSLTADQQAAIGFYCGGNVASLANRITSCDSRNWGANQINIPMPGTQNDDTNPARVIGRHVFGLSAGIDNLFRTDRYRWKLRFTAQNLTNTNRMYNFLSTCSGTHWVAPRSLRAQLTFEF